MFPHAVCLSCVFADTVELKWWLHATCEKGSSETFRALSECFLMLCVYLVCVCRHGGAKMVATCDRINWKLQMGCRCRHSCLFLGDCMRVVRSCPADAQMLAWSSPCVLACMLVSMCACLHARLHVCLHARLHVCMLVSMCAD